MIAMHKANEGEKCICVSFFFDIDLCCQINVFKSTSCIFNMIVMGFPIPMPI